ncbi:MAG: NO-inducible flavohemoprotein [Alphaproteobacteria bacterium]|nr:NO-inducible flavohemoprotein [Alphaproteobacteria bacterium]
MLSNQTITIVKSTAPVLEQHGEALTKHFYKRMFSHNPEVAPLFNPANQFAGSQQRALAAAICAYAANIDNLEVLGGAVELIAQKHASLRIKPEHYPIVGENLLASIREVLGEAATDEIINSWGEAYGFLADILIGREAQIYKEQSAAPGGWEEFKSFRVTRKDKESDIITSFYLVPADGGQLPAFKPGQYITVRVPSPCGHTTMRNYSLSDKPGQDYFRISVKRETGPKADTPKGYVSNLLHDSVEVGSTIEIAPPCGEFFLDVTEKHERPLVLLAGGIGITPIYSILKAALEAMPDRKIILLHGSLHEGVQPFRKEIEQIAAQHANFKTHFRYSEPPRDGITRNAADDTGMIDAALIERLMPEKDSDYYFCGPKPFMVNMYHQLLEWGIPASQVHFEFFGPKQELERKAA